MVSTEPLELLEAGAGGARAPAHMRLDSFSAKAKMPFRILPQWLCRHAKRDSRLGSGVLDLSVVGVISTAVNGVSAAVLRGRTGPLRSPSLE